MDSEVSWRPAARRVRACAALVYDLRRPEKRAYPALPSLRRPALPDPETPTPTHPTQLHAAPPNQPTQLYISQSLARAQEKTADARQRNAVLQPAGLKRIWYGRWIVVETLQRNTCHPTPTPYSRAWVSSHSEKAAARAGRP